MATGLSREHRNWRYRIFALTWIAYAGFYLCRKNFAIAKVPLAEYFGFDNWQLSIIWSAYLFTYAIGQFVNGFLGDVKGPRFMVGLGLFVAVTTNILCGFGESVGVFAILLGLNGLAQSTGWSANVKCMAWWFRIIERGRVMSWWCTCYVVGGIFATWFAAELYDYYSASLQNSAGEAVAAASAWKIIFWGPALVLLIINIAYVLFLRNSPEDAGLAEIDEFEGMNTNNGENAVETTQAAFLDEAERKEKERTATREALRRVFKSRTVWIYGIVYFVLKFIRYGMLSWLPKYAVDELGYDLKSSALLSLGFEALGFLGVLFAGYMSDKVFSARRTPICALMIGGLVIACLLQSQIAYWGMGFYFLGLCLIGFSLYGPDALMTGAAAQDFGSKRAAAMCAGIINGIGSFGALLQEPLIGWATTTYESAWSWLFFVFAGLSVLATVVISFTWNDVPKRQM
ncbi:MAG: MFS transporter [bacterium]